MGKRRASNSAIRNPQSAIRKMWGGRFAKKAHPLMEKFSASVHFDQRLAPYDIQCSMAHVKMLASCKIIGKEDARKIIDGLNQILESVRKGRFVWDEKLEDVHTNIEVALREVIGEVADHLHTARSRNDQVVADLRMYLKTENQTVSDMIRELERSILKLAKRYSQVIIPGYTHLQRAQPVLLAHHLTAYLEMFERDIERLQAASQRMAELPLGSCALAGTSFEIDRDLLRKELELWFNRISANSMDAVSDRDFVIETAAALAIFGVHLSRLSEEFILWSSFEFGFVELPDEFATGSSAMPQKKNPDVFELTRGKSGRLIGNLIRLLVLLKGLPLSYARDLQEDKEAIFDSVDTVKSILQILAVLLPQIEFRTERLSAEGARQPSPPAIGRAGVGLGSASGRKEEEDFTSSLDLAEYLVRKGVPFRQAHEAVGQMVRYCLEAGKTLKDLTLEEAKKFEKAFEKDFKSLLGWSASVEAKKSFGSTNPDKVAKMMKEWARRLS